MFLIQFVAYNINVIFMKEKIIFIFVLLQIVLSTATQNHLSSDQSHSLSMQAAHQAGSSNLGGAFLGFIFGPILFISAFVCIWYNQKRAAIDSRRLQLASQICEDVDVTSQASAISKDGRLVYACGQTRTSAVIGQPLSGISGPNLIKICRYVQVFEWRRHTRRQNNHDYEYYQLEWCQSNSPNQGQYVNNPVNWFVKNDVVYNTQVYLGGYNIDKTTADLCHKLIPFNPTIEHAQAILRNSGRNDKTPTVAGEYIYFSPNAMGGYNPAMNPGYNPNMSPGMGPTYNAPGYAPPMNISSQTPGTVRVKYMLCPTGDITICARSIGATFTSFPIAQYEGTADQTNSVPDCCCCVMSACYAQLLKPIEYIHMVQQQIYTKPQMFQKAIENSQCFTRGLRIGSYFVMVFGICWFFSPLTTLLGYIPLVGGIISGIVGFAILLAALLICIPLFLLATSIAWLRFHPKIGIILLLIGGGLLAFFLIYSKSKSGGSAGGTTAHFMELTRWHHI